MVQGPWDNPMIFPDPQTLIQRSRVTGPLLDALQDKKTRDAVQEVLKRLNPR
jgi:AsmA protein